MTQIVQTLLSLGNWPLLHCLVSMVIQHCKEFLGKFFKMLFCRNVLLVQREKKLSEKSKLSRYAQVLAITFPPFLASLSFQNIYLPASILRCSDVNPTVVPPAL